MFVGLTPSGYHVQGVKSPNLQAAPQEIRPEGPWLVRRASLSNWPNLDTLAGWPYSQQAPYERQQSLQRLSHMFMSTLK